MKSIRNDVIIELKINKSTFINYLVPVSNIEEVEHKINELRSKYSDANHHCFAYILGENQNIQKYSDDGEPSKTAGLPMIEVLKKHDLTNVLNVSVRYFGGIKLGAGGLVRAYTKGCSTCVSEATFSYLEHFNSIKVTVPFSMIGQVEKYLRDNFDLVDTVYDNFVHYILNVTHKNMDILESSINEKTNGIAQIKLLETTKKYV